MLPISILNKEALFQYQMKETLVFLLKKTKLYMLNVNF